MQTAAPLWNCIWKLRWQVGKNSVAATSIEGVAPLSYSLNKKWNFKKIHLIYDGDYGC